MRYNILKTLFLVLFVAFSAAEITAEGVKDGNGTQLSKVAGSPSRTHFNINNISTWIYNNGNSDIKPDGNSGLIFPKGSNLGAVFQSGLVWGGSVDGELRVGGSTYSQGLLPGAVVNGVAEETTETHVRIYRVRPDWETGSMVSEINDGEGTETEIREQYGKDWTEWPASFGAPYEDVDLDGSYDPEIDIPGFPGANQTIWYVANDFDESTAKSLYGSDPMGIEMQATFWGYALGGALGNVMFRKYTLINESQSVFDSMYVSMWADPDLGDAGDDYSGALIENSLMYTYNGNNSDAAYGDNPPAVGFDFFQGPIVAGNPDDEAIFDNKVRTGYKNLPMSAHYFFINSDPVYADPDLGEYVTGTLQFHNLFRGLISASGSPFVDPTTNQQTKFTLSGNPITGEGWVDGILHPPGDRRQGMVAGPFTMAPGDTQEVVIAELAAGGVTGVSATQAVQLLWVYDEIAQSAYDNFFVLPSPPATPTVTATPYSNEILLVWGDDQAKVVETENSVVTGIAGHGEFRFQGYNIYQLPTKSATKEEATRIATFDVVDGVKVILDSEVDPTSGVTLMLPQQYGGDYGVVRSFNVKKDYIKNSQLENGTSYYFAVTAYSYNPDSLSVPNTLENPLTIIEVIPENNIPGEVVESEIGDEITVTHIGSANAVVTANVISPKAVTGNNYEVFFNQQHYYLDVDGKWKKTNYADSVGKSLSKPGDVSPSVLNGVAITSLTSGTIDLTFTLDLVSPTDAWVDGIRLTLPDNIQINSVEDGISNYSGEHITFVQTGNEIFWGNNDTTGGGNYSFAGGEVLVVNVNSFTPPLNYSYVIYDDGYGSGDPPAPINAVGTGTITEIGFSFKTENHWNVRNTTTDEVLIEDQTVLSGIDYYSGEDVGVAAGPITEGLQFNIDGSYGAPTTIASATASVSLNDTELGFNGAYWSNDNYIFTDFTYFGYPDGTVAGSLGPAGYVPGAGGTTSVDLLQQDVELRWTGVLGNEVINGLNLEVTTSGGSYATIIGASGYSIADHPLNPNPGVAEPFAVRVPFEVWNIDENKQINVLMWDRSGNPTADGGKIWNTDNRVYLWAVATDYSPDALDPLSDAVTNFGTWQWVIYQSTFTVNDVIKMSYPNPIQVGKDVFTLTAPNYGYDATKAAEDVKEVNVFPNPYYGVNPNEINKYQRYVTFNHLPPKATIRLFNLGGQLVKTIDKDDATQFTRWSLTNEKGLPVASGIYIAYIDMPELGKTKILKVAIIQETQILDRF